MCAECWREAAACCCELQLCATVRYDVLRTVLYSTGYGLRDCEVDHRILFFSVINFLGNTENRNILKVHIISKKNVLCIGNLSGNRISHHKDDI